MKYEPQKHEWGTDAATDLAIDITPGERRKMRKFKEFAQSADKVPQNYRDPETGRTRVRMVPKDKEIVKKEEVKQVDELSSDKLLKYTSAAQQDTIKRGGVPSNHKRARGMKTANRKIVAKALRGEEVEQVEENLVHVRMDHLKPADHKKMVTDLKKHEKSGHIRFDGESDKGAFFRVKDDAAHRAVNATLRKHYTSADKMDEEVTVHESVEQVDELKKSTLASYIKKSAQDQKIAARFSDEKYPGHKDARNVANKRGRGISMAADKLAREEVEHLDESQKLANKRAELRKKMFGDANYLSPAQRKQLDKAAKAELKKEREVKKAAPKAKTTTKTAKGKTHTGSAEAADKHIIMQMRKAQDYGAGKHPIRVSPTRTVMVPHTLINKALEKHDAMGKPEAKRTFRIQLIKSLRKAGK